MFFISFLSSRYVKSLAVKAQIESLTIHTQKIK